MVKSAVPTPTYDDCLRIRRVSPNPLQAGCDPELPRPPPKAFHPGPSHRDPPATEGQKGFPKELALAGERARKPLHPPHSAGPGQHVVADGTPERSRTDVRPSSSRARPPAHRTTDTVPNPTPLLLPSRRGKRSTNARDLWQQQQFPCMVKSAAATRQTSRTPYQIR